MSDKLSQEVQTIVDDILKQKEDAELVKATEDALNRSATKITELSTSLEAKDAELVVSNGKVAELEVTIAELSDKTKEFEANLAQLKKDFDAEKVELVKRAETAETELTNMKKDLKSKARFEELKAEGVAATDEKTMAEQIAKIRDMEDAIFATYKAERIELRKAIVAELEASAAAAANKVDDTTKTNTTDVDVKLEDDKAAAASKDSIDPMKAVAAMLNLETIPTGETKAKYRELGQALAERAKSKAKKRGN